MRPSYPMGCAGSNILGLTGIKIYVLIGRNTYFRNSWNRNLSGVLALAKIRVPLQSIIRRMLISNAKLNFLEAQNY